MLTFHFWQLIVSCTDHRHPWRIHQMSDQEIKFKQIFFIEKDIWGSFKLHQIDIFSASFRVYHVIDWSLSELLWQLSRRILFCRESLLMALFSVSWQHTMNVIIGRGNWVRHRGGGRWCDMMMIAEAELGGDNNNIDTGIKIDFSGTWSMGSRRSQATDY